MFGELTKLRELGRLLKKRRYLEALALARDPAIRDHRKAVVGAEKAREALLSVAEEQRARGEVKRAAHGKLQARPSEGSPNLLRRCDPCGVLPRGLLECCLAD